MNLIRDLLFSSKLLNRHLEDIVNNNADVVYNNELLPIDKTMHSVQVADYRNEAVGSKRGDGFETRRWVRNEAMGSKRGDGFKTRRWVRNNAVAWEHS